MRTVVYYGGDGDDRILLAEALKGTGVSFRVKPLAGLYGRWDIAPRWLRKRWSFRICHAFSPWVDALRIAWRTADGDVVMIKNHRSAIAYLWAIYPWLWRRHAVVLPWFTLPTMPARRNLGIYRRALARARKIFTYTTKERTLYSSVFGLSPERFAQVRLHASAIPPAALEPVTSRFDAIMTGVTSRDWETFAAVCAARPQLKFAAVAPLAQLGAIAELPNLTKIEAVPFLEYCRLIRSAKVVLLLLHDNFGAVGQRDFLVAGALGSAVVATKVESLALYAREGSSVRFVEPRNVAGALQALDLLVQDAPARAQLAAALRQSVCERHSLSAVAAEWAPHLAEVLAK